MTRSALDHDAEDAAEEGTTVPLLRARLRAASGKGPSRAKAARAPATSIAKVEADRGRKNSRVKGSRAELDVAAAFSRWCGEEVRRTPLSGGWSSARFGVTADLVCANPAFPFHVEIKHREGWTLDDLITGVRAAHDKSVVQWWAQCVASCPRRPSGRRLADFAKEPLLVFRRNRQPWLAMCRSESPIIRTINAPAVFTINGDAGGDDVVCVSLLSSILAGLAVPPGMKNSGKAK